MRWVAKGMRISDGSTLVEAAEPVRDLERALNLVLDGVVGPLGAFSELVRPLEVTRQLEFNRRYRAARSDWSFG